MVARKVVCVAVLWAVVMAAAPSEALTCGQVSSSVAPCLGFLTGRGGVSPQCCGGIRSLLGIAHTPIDRRTACGCLKTAARNIRGINFGRAAGLPGACKVNIPYKISPTTDCSRVK